MTQMKPGVSDGDQVDRRAPAAERPDGGFRPVRCGAGRARRTRSAGCTRDTSATVLSDVTMGTRAAPDHGGEARHHDGPDGRSGRSVAGVDRAQHSGERSPFIARQRIDGARSRGDRGEAAEPHRHRSQRRHCRCRPAAPSPACMIAITAGTGSPARPWPRTPGMFGIAAVSAISSTYPATPETATESTMPQGACRRGSDVSSAMWAEASKPV